MCHKVDLLMESIFGLDQDEAISNSEDEDDDDDNSTEDMAFSNFTAVLMVVKMRPIVTIHAVMAINTY